MTSVSPATTTAFPPKASPSRQSTHPGGLHAVTGTPIPVSTVPSPSIPTVSAFPAEAKDSSTITGDVVFATATPASNVPLSNNQPGRSPPVGIVHDTTQSKLIPKEALHSLYGRSPRRKIISQNCYFTWHDNGPPHNLKWTTVFVCPITGECFLSGRYGASSNYTLREDGEVWYSKKTFAEHAAAARCYDCSIWRDEQVAPTGRVLCFAGHDPPYGAHVGLKLPSFMPEDVRQGIVSIREEIGVHGIHAMEVDATEQTEVETVHSDDENDRFADAY